VRRIIGRDGARGRGIGRPAGILILGAALFVTACSSQHGRSLPPLGSAVAPAPATAAPFTDSAALQAKLLGVADMPPGFDQLDDGGGNGPTPQDRSHTDPAACARVLDAVSSQVAGASASGAVHYSSPDFDSIDIDAASYPNGAAAQAFSTTERLVRQCTAYAGTDADGTAVTYRIGGLDQPRAGDSSMSFQLQTSSQGLTLYSAATLALVGSTVVQIARAGQKPVPPPALSALTATQVQRLQGIAGP